MFFDKSEVLVSQQESLSGDTDAALSNMRAMGDAVKEDHQSLVSHVCKHVFHIWRQQGKLY